MAWFLLILLFVTDSILANSSFASESLANENLIDILNPSEKESKSLITDFVTSVGEKSSSPSFFESIISNSRNSNPCKYICENDSNKTIETLNDIVCFCPENLDSDTKTKEKIVDSTRKKISQQFFEEFKESLVLDNFALRVDKQFTNNINAGSEVDEEKNIDCIAQFSSDDKFEEFLETKRKKQCPSQVSPIQKLLKLDSNLENKIQEMNFKVGDQFVSNQDTYLALKVSLDDSNMLHNVLNLIQKDKESLKLSNKDFLASTLKKLKANLKEKNFLQDICITNGSSSDKVFYGLKVLSEVCKKFNDSETYGTVPNERQVSDIAEGMVKVIQFHPYVRNFFVNSQLRSAISKDNDYPFKTTIISPSKLNNGAAEVKKYNSLKCEELVNNFVSYLCLSDDELIMSVSDNDVVANSLNTEEKKYLDCFEKKSTNQKKMSFDFFMPSNISSDEVRENISKELKEFKKDNTIFVEQMSLESRRRIEDYYALTKTSGKERDSYFEKRHLDKQLVAQEIAATYPERLSKKTIENNSENSISNDKKNIIPASIPQKLMSENSTSVSNPVQRNQSDDNLKSAPVRSSPQSQNKIVNEKINENQIITELSKIAEYEKRIKDLEFNLENNVLDSEKKLPQIKTRESQRDNKTEIFNGEKSKISTENISYENLPASYQSTDEVVKSSRANLSQDNSSFKAYSNLIESKNLNPKQIQDIISKAVLRSGFIPTISEGVVIKNEEMTKNQILSEINQKILLGEISGLDLTELKKDKIKYRYLLKLADGQEIEREVEINLSELPKEIKEKILENKEGPAFKRQQEIVKLRRAHYLSSLKILLLQEK